MGSTGNATRHVSTSKSCPAGGPGRSAHNPRSNAAYNPEDRSSRTYADGHRVGRLVAPERLVAVVSKLQVMSIRSGNSTSRARRALWLAGLLLLLAGLFGMHGLSSHGTSSLGSRDHGQISAADSDSPMPAVTHTGDAAVQAGEAPSMGAVLGTVLSPQQPLGLGTGAVAMCLAVLILSLMALLVGLRQHLPTVMAKAGRPSPSPPVRGRDPDPPSLVRLSIQRC